MILPALNFPDFPFSVRTEESVLEIFDRVRKKWVKLTPEEWVRQHVIWYLIDYLFYPESLMQVEYGLTIHHKKLRIDVAAFSPTMTPLLLCECKAPEVKISHSTLTQLGLYNRVYQSSVILLTNGREHYCFAYQNKRWQQLTTIPDYKELIKS